MAVGALLYVGHRVKQAVMEKAATYGVDLHSGTRGNTSAERTKTYKVCDLLSKEEAATLLGEPIDHTEEQSDMCLYYGPPGLSEKLATQGMSDVVKRASGPGAHVNGGDVANSVDSLVNSIAAGAGQGTTPGKELPLLNLGLSHDGKAQMIALNAAKALFSGFEGSGAEVPESRGSRRARG